MNKNNFGQNSQVKYKKLIRFINQPIWALLIKNMPINKDDQVIIFVKSYLLQETNMGWNKKNKKNQIAIGMAQKIIIKGVSSQITFNIININNLKDIWDIFE